MLHYQALTSWYWSRGLKDSCEEEASSEDSQDNDEEITRRRRPIKKGMHEKTPFDGVFLAIQTLEEEKLIKRYRSW
jgi:hypothetical protein